jgi:tRNA U34 2-thiouridine synthase MnmA/TrmU
VNRYRAASDAAAVVVVDIMNLTEKKVRALGLCSGGLDSILSGLVLRRQGIAVEWISFETPFFSARKARKASALTGIPLRVEDITPSYLEMLKEPNCGYGQHMNPCLDCHSLMFRHAGRIMQSDGFDFLFSGEVVGQRPMSQTRPSLRYVEKNSGFDGYILRPLSARLLPETIPEKEGLVDREGLLDISGRGRKRQIALAEEFGVTEYPAPAGGCLLTDKNYCRRLRDLFDCRKPLDERELHLLRYGRHFRLDKETKLIVGRTQTENERMLDYHDPAREHLLKTRRYPGPIGLVSVGASENLLILAAAICAGYSKAPDDLPAQVDISGAGMKSVLPVRPADVQHLLISP